MSETWKRWEGRTVDGRFPLQSYLGASDHSAVFLTLTQGGAGDSEKAAIKLISADADAEGQLARWKVAGELTHPNLIRIFEAGRCVLDGVELLYVVEESAEENLSQILPERALTAEEAGSMLSPVLRALQFVHDKGLVHGHIQPSNILAIGDEVKLSSDALGVAGERTGGARATCAYDPPEAATEAASAATDVWQLGMTLVEVLTQRLPEWDRASSTPPVVPGAVPEPFREIAGRCLQSDPGKRWTVAEIVNRLQPVKRAPAVAQTEKAFSPAAISGRQKATAKWPYWLALAAVVAIIFVLVARPKHSAPTDEQSAPNEKTAAENSPPTRASGKPKPSAAGDEGGSTDDQVGVVQRVMPQVSPSARRTIQGTIKVRVKVNVDAAGNVDQAKLESAGPSKYFSRISLEAARDWKFSPARAGEADSREWKLQFAFTRSKTHASVAPGKR